MDKIFKKAYYIVLGILIMVFFSQDIDLSKIVKNPDDILVLVNKQHNLPSDYVPNDLETISLKYANTDKQLRKIAKEHFEQLSDEALNQGYTIIAVSTYRSYDYQKDLFDRYTKDKGLEYAKNCCAKPGHSEHQTGLAVDVEGDNHDYDNFEETKDFIWMKENAHKYGFILRYPKNKADITGFKYEPWHYRYVGVEVATYIHYHNLTLEEYLNEF